MNDFVLQVLSLAERLDFPERLYWGTADRYAPVTFFINCNDLFYWACADAEKIQEGDVEAIEKAVSDVKRIYLQHYSESMSDIADTAFDLWAARKRKMRPQNPAYPSLPELRVLFDACGPERSAKEQG